MVESTVQILHVHFGAKHRSSVLFLEEEWLDDEKPVLVNTGFRDTLGPPRCNFFPLQHWSTKAPILAEEHGLRRKVKARLCPLLGKMTPTRYPILAIADLHS